MKIAVFGSGGWGTALACLLSANHEVTLCSHSEKSAELLRNTRENPYLKGILVPENIKITSDKAEAAEGIGIAVAAPPSYAFRETLEGLKGLLPEGCILANVSKGLEEGTGRLFSQVAEEILLNVPYCMLSGPSHAEEVARNEPTLCVAASKCREVAVAVQDAFMTDFFRVYSSSDVVGVQLGGALKNIIAIAAGICDGLNLGDNTKAALVTRGLTEIARLGVTLGGRQDTFGGLAGIGDLFVTCTSEHSRNRRMGRMVGRGMPPNIALERVGGVVEGYYAVRAARLLAKKTGAEMPITEQVYQILFKGLEPEKSIRSLMTRSKKHESETVWMSGEDA